VTRRRVPRTALPTGRPGSQRPRVRKPTAASRFRQTELHGSASLRLVPSLPCWGTKPTGPGSLCRQDGVPQLYVARSPEATELSPNRPTRFCRPLKCTTRSRRRLAQPPIRNHGLAVRAERLRRFRWRESRATTVGVSPPKFSARLSNTYTQPRRNENEAKLRSGGAGARRPLYCGSEQAPPPGREIEGAPAPYAAVGSKGSPDAASKPTGSFRHVPKRRLS